ncbi:hypothetical protein B1757_00440 [Acidithiobacillus marinus]|uniref:AsmA-like C-terminal domain-containing protein n=1 Tax=Acidithiobacillus marinus TaxID=187490 RepID=A0A2I1DQR8_9PROT|nr:hypothetical protein [Acidithiobacillus marinus]PKY12179.1 hypothetical protein B1757_00440 [Acidithiobacillus marinus]
MLLLLFLLVLAGLIFWLVGGPRLLLEEYLGAQVQMPVQLADNPSFYWGKRYLQVFLQGLRIGPERQPTVQVQRLMLSLPWRPLLTGKVQIQQIFLDQPAVNLPWPEGEIMGSAKSHSSTSFTLPADIQIRNGSLCWHDLAGHELSLSDIAATLPRSGMATVTGVWTWKRHTGPLQLQMMLQSGKEFSIHHLQLLIASHPAWESWSLQLPSLQMQQHSLWIPAMQLHWLTHKGRQVEGAVHDLHVQLSRQILEMGSATLDMGPDFNARLEHGHFSWAQGSGQTHYRVTAQHLPVLARQWGLPWPKLNNPKVPEQFIIAGALSWKNSQFHMVVHQGQLDNSSWSGQISGTWNPLALHLNLRISSLNLNAYLPAPKPGPEAILPRIPEHWPVTGVLHIGKLNWGKIRAEDVLIQSPKKTGSEVATP